MRPSMLMTLVIGCMVALLFTVSLAQDTTPDEYLNAHNNARSQVGVPPLVWNNTLAAYAQSYVSNRTGDCSLMLSDTEDYGENVFVGTANYNGVDAVNAWVDEKQNYDRASNSCQQGKECRHYTQVVWRASTNLGCACAKCNNGSVYVSCDYYPAGNVVGQTPY